MKRYQILPKPEWWERRHLSKTVHHKARRSIERTCPLIFKPLQAIICRTLPYCEKSMYNSFFKASFLIFSLMLLMYNVGWGSASILLPALTVIWKKNRCWKPLWRWDSSHFTQKRRRMIDLFVSAIEAPHSIETSRQSAHFVCDAMAVAQLLGPILEETDNVWYDLCG